MATIGQLDLNLALIPLLSHRVEIARLVLVKPNIILETDAQGRPNWQFTREQEPAVAPSTSAGTPDTAPTRISVADVRIEDGTLTWRDDRAGRNAVFGLTSLHASAASPDANVNLAMSATYDGTPFTLTAEFGPLTWLLERDTSAPWPVQARLEATGAKLAVDGIVAQPLQGRGYRVKLSANVPDVAALAPFLPEVKLPALHDVSLAAQVADTGAAMPEVSGVALQVGRSDLTGTMAGLRLDKVDIAAATLDQPVQVSAQGSFNDAPAFVTGSLGGLTALLSAAKTTGPIPLDLTVQALGSHLTIKGKVARRQDGRPSVQADVTADKIDLDAMLAVHRNPPGVAAAAPAAMAAKPPVHDRIIPDTPIPFDLLRLADAELKLSIRELQSGTATYRAIVTQLDLHGGKLRLDPLSADLPEGHLDGSLEADAAQLDPAVALRLRIPALALQPVLAALNQPAFVSGNLNVQADLHGAGATPHAIAASLDGSLGLTMTNGTVDNRLLGSALGTILRAANLLDLVGRGGTSEVQCFVARLDANHGIATVRPLAFASTLLTMDGDGSLNLGAETLDLRVRPQARLAGVGLVVPLRISGPFRSPSAMPDPTAAVMDNAGTVAGAALSGATPLGLIAGALGKTQLLGGSDAGCGAAAPSGRTALPAPQQQKPPKVGDVLKQLFR
jgi:AsmA protein